MIDSWPHPACLPEEDLLRQCTLDRGRSSGPGGQHRNKVETLVTISHVPSGIQAHAGERRSQAENKRVAVFRLRLTLAVEVRSTVPVGEIGSRLWRSRTGGGRIACNPEHEDFPAMLAEAMDVLGASGWEPRKAALRLDVTASQLVKLVKDHPPAFVRVNRERAAKGGHPLK
ncbi:MAG: peptide chain release factor-like protein [Phycisphaeraceae bacterium]|nr:peptide chain release factor-like protein [Phycisphaeraceae bacterium]